MQTEERALATIDPSRNRTIGHLKEQAWNAQDIEVIKETLCPGIDDANLKLFAHQCARLGLDPFSRQIYVIKRAGYEDGQKVDKFTIQTGIDGFRLIADRTGNYRPGEISFAGTVRIGDKSYPETATATIYKYVRGEWFPVSATAYFVEYVQRKRDGTPTQMWDSKPRTMLGKCAETLAIRKGFPAELSGVYSAEEMDQADNPPIVQEVPESRNGRTEEARTESAPKSGPIELATAAQVKALFVIARNERQLDETEFRRTTRMVYESTPENLTRRQASEAIDRMKAGDWPDPGPNLGTPVTETPNGSQSGAVVSEVAESAEVKEFASESQIATIKELFTAVDIHGKEMITAIQEWTGRKSANRLNLTRQEAELVTLRLGVASYLTDIGFQNMKAIDNEVEERIGRKGATAKTLTAEEAARAAHRFRCAHLIMQTGVAYAGVDAEYANWAQRPDATLWNSPDTEIDELIDLLEATNDSDESETDAEPAE